MTRSRARRAGRQAALKARKITRGLKTPLVFDGTISPFKTVLFVVICLAWLIPGLVGHDPWKGDESRSIGFVHSELSGEPAVIPSLAGMPLQYIRRYLRLLYTL